MAKIEAEIVEQQISNGAGKMVDGVVATCSECGEQTESYGTGEKSRRRCLVLLKENCPHEANNFYVERGGDE